MARHLEHRLKIRHLRVVDAIEQHARVLRAAQVLQIGQPAPTRTVQTVEEMICGDVFGAHRSSRDRLGSPQIPAYRCQEIRNAK